MQPTRSSALLTSLPSSSQILFLSRRQNALLRSIKCASTQNRSYSEQKQYQSTSDKLFADAAKEEAEEAATAKRVSKAQILEQQHQNWTGDESVQDAVLRMLVDKYKPLRSGVIQSAEEKIKRAPPTIGGHDAAGSSSLSFSVPLEPASGSWADEPLLPSSESHRPWHTTYKPPSHDSVSIKTAQLPPLISTRAGPKTTDERLLKKERDERKRLMQAGRLNQARESTLDYRLGIKRKPGGRGGLPNPTNEKGWASLVEDRIEKARASGAFRNVKGRGQPITRSHEEYNPFIGREEFLMNRIVQRNGAAPPWVDVQGELETAVNSFREILRQTWVRRAVRILSMSHVGHLPDKISMNSIKSLRDPEWVKREESYHNAAIEELNSLVRKYNGLAPYAVRRPYYIRTVEIDNMYERCVEDIKQALIESASDPGLPEGYKASSGGGSGGSSGAGSVGGDSGNANIRDDISWGLGDLVRSLVGSFASRWKAR